MSWCFFEFCSDVKHRILQSTFYPDYELLEELSNITLDDLKDFAKNWTKQLKIKCLFQGNILESQVRSIVQNICDILKPSPIEDVSDARLIIFYLSVLIVFDLDFLDKYARPNTGKEEVLFEDEVPSAWRSQFHGRKLISIRENWQRNWL